MTATQPDAQMMAPIEKVALFLETLDDAFLSAFADHDVSIVENFAPYLFDGPDAVDRWARGMRAHLRDTQNLRHRFAPALTVDVTDRLAYLSVPTTWTGLVGGRRFDEDGGWAFVLVMQDGEWRVRSYGWAVTRLSTG